MGKRSKYVTVASRRSWTLAYPRALWERMTPDEREAVVQRQERLFNLMEKAQGVGLAKHAALP